MVKYLLILHLIFIHMGPISLILLGFRMFIFFFLSPF